MKTQHNWDDPLDQCWTVSVTSKTTVELFAANLSNVKLSLWRDASRPSAETHLPKEFHVTVLENGTSIRCRFDGAALVERANVQAGRHNARLKWHLIRLVTENAIESNEDLAFPAIVVRIR